MAAGIGPEVGPGEPVVAVERGMPRRTLGRTGLRVSIVGFSGFALKDESPERCHAAGEALRLFPFDSVMFPMNYVEYYTRGFGKEVLNTAPENGAAVLAIKPMNAGAPKPGETLKHQWWRR
jgi:aryl-alcohol dehydrogenase-like predicted oxidoreductase